MAVGRLALTPEEVGQCLGISRSMVYDLMARGELQSFKIGVNRRVSVAALRRYIASLEGDTADIVVGLDEMLHRINGEVARQVVVH